MMRAFVSILFLGLALAPADAADRTITVDGEACSFKVRFDPGKFSEKQVRDTAGAILGSVLPYPDFAVHPTTDTLTPEIVAADQAACQQSIGRSRGLDLMDIPGLAEFRARKTDQTVDTCAFEAIKGRALVPGANPKILLEHAASAKACGHFVPALENRAGLRAFWRELVGKRCVDNSDPARCRKDSLALEQKPDADELIRRDVIGFDWTNCAIEFLTLNQERERDEATREALQKEFMRRFRTKANCDD
ncbi:MAG: hypothetical protein H6872_05200 [Methylobacteriaceae bacterium]|nr:hypothetical protein [Rhodoblastus sp.]MCC0004548.1 hypothetical protein [Methylobacteriaceae bacterium]